MYCPRCGQQQMSEETKFCSRCGFPLNLVSEILAHGGFLPQLAELHKSKKRLTKKNGIAFSVLWAKFFMFIMAPFWALAGVPEMAAVSGIVGLFGGLMWLIASLLILKNPTNDFFAAQELPNANVNNLYETNQRVLPPQSAQSYVPPANAWKAPNTGEFATPQSITEGTTKLLNKDE